MSFIFWLWGRHVQLWIYYRFRNLDDIFSWHVTASVGKCVWFQTWEMKIATKHLSWVGLHLFLMRSFIYKVIWQETSCRDVFFTDGNIHSLLSFRMMDTLSTICVCVYIYSTKQVLWAHKNYKLFWNPNEDIGTWKWFLFSLTQSVFISFMIRKQVCSTWPWFYHSEFLHLGLQISCSKFNIACPAAWSTWFDIEGSTRASSRGSILGVLLDIVVSWSCSECFSGR